ncbi:MAG: NAD(P)H-dependent oxidoreductase [Pararhodobacter sp.]|nr:NAD(P)H-dependent oxidoreductase [Pararhodobacter sp.]
MPVILGLCGSLRAASSSAALMRTLAERLAPRVRLEIADIAALPHYNADIEGNPQVARLIEQISAADGLLFVTPEYNYSVPGLLKNALDWASRPAYKSVFKGKPALVISVSGGALGGVRAQAHLKYILNGMLAVNHVGQEIVVTHANRKVENGRFTDEATLDFALAELDSFIASLNA